MDRQKALFLTNGADSLTERQKIGDRLESIRAEIKQNFPLTDGESSALRDHLREKILAVQSAERTAAFALRRAMG